MKIRQSTCHWCLKDVPLAELCQAAAGLGLQGVDLVGADGLAVLRQYGLTPTLWPSHDIGKGLNRVENHPACLARISAAIAAAADAGAPGVVCFSGNRAGMDNEEGARNCVLGLKQVAPLAESRGVTLCLELLNSAKDHADYMADSTAWAAGVVDAVGSPRVKLLFDIYHMHVQGENVLEMIRTYHARIGHYHTAGAPGRHELDATQEIDYAAVRRAIGATGYQGWIAHEFIPTRDWRTGLAEAVRLCA